jgi:hypothetical protein
MRQQALSKKEAVVWDVTPYSPVEINRRSESISSIFTS